jgi:hypothetical protein
MGTVINVVDPDYKNPDPNPDPDKHQFADDKPKCSEYEPF